MTIQTTFASGINPFTGLGALPKTQPEPVMQKPTQPHKTKRADEDHSTPYTPPVATPGPGLVVKHPPSKSPQVYVTQDELSVTNDACCGYADAGDCWTTIGDICMTTLRQAARAVVDRWDKAAGIDSMTQRMKDLRAALDAPGQEPVGYVFAYRDIIGSVIGAKGEWAPHEIPLYAAPVEAPDIKVLQAEGKGPAPCARFCESKAFSIEIRNLEGERDKLTRANKDLIDWFDAIKADHDKRLTAGKLALEACVGFSRAPMTQVEYLSLLRVIAALKAAGVS